MDIEIINEFNYNADYKYLDDVINLTLEQEKAGDVFFTIIFVDEKKIQELNKNYRGIDRVTDVISFAFLDNEDFIKSNLRILGEIYICIPRMKEQAVMYGHSEKRELSFLTVHGILHLLGYDHMTKEEEKIMFARQDKVLDALNIKR